MKLGSLLFHLILLCFSITSQAQETEVLISVVDVASVDEKPDTSIQPSATGLKYMNMMDSSLIRKNLYTLASEEFSGRKPGQEGGLKTQKMLVDELKAMGVLSPAGVNYTQDIGRYEKERRTEKLFEYNKFNYATDYGYTNSFLKDSLISTKEILFLGYGNYSSTVNDFATVDVTDKVVMFLPGKSYNKFGGEYAINDGRDEYLMKQKPKAMITIEGGYSSNYYAYTGVEFAVKDSRNRRRDVSSEVPQIQVNERLANRLLEQSGKSVKQLVAEIESKGSIEPIVIEAKDSIKILSPQIYRNSKAENIIGFIEGTDLKDEYVLVMAHHDHLGKSDYYSRTYYGADDNASGVSAVLEVARLFAKAKKEKNAPRRSIIILFTSAEEEYLKGAQYYVENPIFPLNKTIACLNLDMVGRRDASHADKSNVYISKNKKSLSLAEDISALGNNDQVSLKVDLTDQNYSRSDHYSFNEYEIPAVMFTGGEHDDYHTERDTADRIDYTLLFSRAKLAFISAWTLANPAK